MAAGVSLALAGCGKSHSSASDASPASDAPTQEPAAKESELTPERARNAGIETVVAGEAQIRTTLTLHGTIRPNAEREQDIRARYPGVVRDVSKRVGDRLPPRKSCCELSPMRACRPIPSGHRFRVASLSGGRIQVMRLMAVPCYRVADLSTVWVEFALFARDLGQVRPGMSVSFRGANADDASEAKIDMSLPLDKLTARVSWRVQWSITAMDVGCPVSSSQAK